MLGQNISQICNVLDIIAMKSAKSIILILDYAINSKLVLLVTSFFSNASERFSIILLVLILIPIDIGIILLVLILVMIDIQSFHQ